jgi:hypothetical protein
MRKSKCLFYKMTAVIKVKADIITVILIRLDVMVEADIITVILIRLDVMVVIVNVKTTKPNVFVFIGSV